MRVHHVALGTALTALLVGGCTESTPAAQTDDTVTPGQQASEPPSPPPPASSGAVYERWQNREPYFDCGYIPLNQGERLRLDEDQMDCMIGHDDEGAELAVSRYTVEGDLIVSYYRVKSGAFETYTDSTRDGFGSGRLSYRECAGRVVYNDMECVTPTQP